MPALSPTGSSSGINLALSGFRVDVQKEADTRYWQSCLTPEDTQFINTVGLDHGLVETAHGSFVCLAQRLYVDEFDKSKTPQEPVYHSAASVKLNDKAMVGLQHKIKHRSLPPEELAHVVRELNSLQSGIDIVVTCSNMQMVKLLEEAKLIFTQRGVDGEAQVVDAMVLINDVLANMAWIKEHGYRNGSEYFVDLYSRPVKYPCELAVGLARNPFALGHEFFTASESREEKLSWEKRLEKAMEPLREEARKMAEVLKEHLARYAVRLGAGQASGATESVDKSSAPQNYV